MHAYRRSRRRKVWTGYEQGCVLMRATRAGLFKRLIALEDKQRAAWVKEWAALDVLLDTMIRTTFEGLSDEEVQAMRDLEIDSLNPFVVWVRSLGATTYEDSYLSEVNGWTGQIILALAKESPPPSYPVPPLPAYDPRPSLVSIALLERNADSGPNPEGTRLHVRAVRAHLVFLEAVAGRWPGES